MKTTPTGPANPVSGAQDNISIEKSPMDTKVMYLLHVFWG